MKLERKCSCGSVFIVETETAGTLADDAVYEAFRNFCVLHNACFAEKEDLEPPWEDEPDYYKQGVEAFRAGLKYSDHPPEGGMEVLGPWQAGYRTARLEAKIDLLATMED